MSLADFRDRLNARELQAALIGGVIGHRVWVFEQTRSTNDVAWQLAEAEIAEGAVVFAERQTAGRGQQGRPWESAAHKGLWFSVLLRPPLTLDQSFQLTGLFAHTLASTIEAECACATTIKAPNDIYISGRKAAGILVEGRVAGDGRYVAVAGVGLNVNHALGDFSEELRSSATSLAIVTGAPMSRLALATAFLANLDRAYGEFRKTLPA